MPPCPPHLAHTASRVSSPTCLPSFHLIFLSSDLFAAACLFSCFFPYSGSFFLLPCVSPHLFQRIHPREVRPNLPALLGEGTGNPHNIIPPVRQIQLEQPADLPRRQRKRLFRLSERLLVHRLRIRRAIAAAKTPSIRKNTQNPRS